MKKITNRELIQKLKTIIANKTPKVFKNNDNYIIVVPEEVIYIRGDETKVIFTLIDGTTDITTEPIGEIKKRFNDCFNFISGDELSLINSDYICRSTYENGTYKVYFSSPWLVSLSNPYIEYARVTPANAKEFSKVLGIYSLRWCKNYKRVMSICQRFNIRLFEKNIKTFSKERLIKEFSDVSGNLVISNLLYNLIWQVYNRMINKELPEDEILMGNIRSFWYTYFKPLLSVLNMVDEKRYNDMIEAFTNFTADWKLFKYKDWDFLDIKRYNKKIGKGKRIYLILVSEKEGHLRILEYIYEKYGITTIALGGEASVLSIEYFVDDLEATGINKDKTFHIFFTMDYDPAGMNIQKTFISKLKRHGIKNIVTHDLITLDRFTPEEIAINKFSLITEESENFQTWITRVRKWVQKTGGIGPQGTSWKKRAYGMEVDAIPPGKLIKIFEEEAKGYLK